MHPWRDRCLGKVQVYAHWSRLTWCNFRLAKVGWLRLYLHQHFSCMQQHSFEVNPVSTQYWCWGLSTKTASFSWSTPLARGYLDIFSNADTAQLLAAHIKPLLWAVERNQEANNLLYLRQISGQNAWKRPLSSLDVHSELWRPEWRGPIPAPHVQFYVHSATGEELAPDHVVPRRSHGTALCDRRGYDPQGTGAKHLILGPHNSGTGLGQDLSRWMQLGTKKVFPVSSVVKDLPISDVSCQPDTCQPQRKDCTIVSKFVTALYFWHKKRKIFKETNISLN